MNGSDSPLQPCALGGLEPIELPPVGADRLQQVRRLADPPPPVLIAVTRRHQQRIVADAAGAAMTATL